jgi:hypothetical protein
MDSSMIRIICSIIAVVLIAVFIMRRRKKEQ